MTITITATATTEQELTAEMKKTSLQHPNKIIVAFGRLGIVEIIVLSQQPRTDTAAAAQTFRLNGGFFKNGKIVKPTKTFLKKFHSCPASR